MRGNTSHPAFNTNSLPPSHCPTLERYILSCNKNTKIIFFFLISFLFKGGLNFKWVSSAFGVFFLFRNLILVNSSQNDLRIDSDQMVAISDKDNN